MNTDNTQNAITDATSIWPTIDDFPQNVEHEVITCSDFDLEMRKMLVENPFAPPKGCPISRLPNELLAYIFYLGTYADDEDDEDEGDADADDEDDDDYVEYEDKIEVEEDDDDEEWEDAQDGSEESQKDVGVEDVTGIRPESPGMTESYEIPFQVLVSHVCRHWRAIAIESPALWTSITFTERPPFDRARAYIARSQSLALDITLDCTSVDDDDDDDENEESSKELLPYFSKEELSAILDIIMPLVERWRKIEIMVSFYEDMHTVLLRLSKCGPAPNLELLQLYSHEDSEEYEKFEPVDLNQSFVLFNGIAPNLTIVGLWGVHVDWSTPLLSGLVDLELAYHAKDVRPLWADFSRILVGSPNIETLTLSLSGPAGQPNGWPDTPIELPSLKNLVLAYQEPDYICALIKLLWIPNVTSLALDFDSDDYTSLAKELAASRSSPDTRNKGKSILANLESLKLSGLPCDHRTVDTIYEQLGDLKSINLNCTSLDEIFFNKLVVTSEDMATGCTVPTAKSIYCPLLEVITTSGIEGWKMCELVKWRKEHGIPIKKVFMSEEDNVGTWEQSWLRENVESFAYFEPSDSEDDAEVFEEDDGIDEDEDD